MKRLYTLLLSGFVLAASASVAVPTAMRHLGKVTNTRSELFEKASHSRQLRTLAPGMKKASASAGMTAGENALAFSGKMLSQNIKSLKPVKHHALSSRIDFTAPATILKAPRKAPEAIADYTGTYTFACNWLISSGSAPATVTVTVTDEATGAAEITGLVRAFSTPLNATFDLAAGTLSIPNKQLLGRDDDGDVYFYIKSITDDYEFVDGASAAEATVGTISGSLISFPQFDIWAVGDFNNEDLGYYFLSYTNRMQLAEPEDPNKDPNEGWTSLGNATFMDGWLLPGVGIDQTNRENWYEVELQQNDENKAVYRLVNPYKGNCPLAAINQSTKNGYIQFDVTDPDHVVFANVDAGFVFADAGITEFYCNNNLSYYVNGGYPASVVIEQLGDQIPYTTFKDGVLTLGRITTDDGVYNDACYGTQNKKNALYGWNDENDDPANMSVAVYFPGTPLPADPIEPEYSVYSNSLIGEGLVLNSWWNSTLEANTPNPDGEGNVFSMTNAGSLEGNFSAGFQTPDKEQSTVTGPLHSATLGFDWYATTPCTITVRLAAGKEENKTVTVTADDVNKWNHTELNVTEDFPDVATAWKDWTTEGKNNCVFGVVVEQFNADTKVYFNNVAYTNCDTEWKQPAVEPPFWPVAPVPTQAADNVMSLLSAKYRPVMGFNFNQWGSATGYDQNYNLEDGSLVARMSNFTYLGWEFYEHIDVSSMEYLHVDFYPMASTAFAVTPISPSHEKLYTVAAENVKAGEWNSIDVPLTYFEGVDFADLFQFKFAEGNESTVYVTNVYFYKDAPVNPDPVDVTGDYIGTFGDYYFEGSIGSFEKEVTITQNGTDVTLDCEYFPAPVKATIDPATGVITFTNEYLGTGKFQPGTLHIRFEPMHAVVTEAGDETDVEIVVEPYSATYNPETHEITFPSEHYGFSWALYSDAAMTTVVGYMDMFDVVKLTLAPVVDPNEGWTSLGEATFQDGWLLTLPSFKVDNTDRANWYKVELQQNDENENIYRLVDPYKGNCPVAQYNESTKPGYIQFDVTDPDHVVFATDVKAGFANSQLGISSFYCSTIYSAMYEAGKEYGLTTEDILAVMDENYPNSSYHYSTYKDGIVTVPCWISEDGIENEAAFGLAAGEIEYCWTDSNKDYVNMEAKIFFPGVDSIRELNAKSEATSEVYYNLHGQRIAKPTVPGLYIRNNQKIVVR